MRVIKFILRWLKRLLTIFGVLLILLLGAWHIRPVREVVVRRLFQSFSTPGFQVAGSDVSIRYPLQVQIGRVALSDRNGQWLEARDVVAKVQLRDALRGRVILESLAASDLTWHRRPTVETNNGTAVWPTLEIDEIAVSHITLPDPFGSGAVTGSLHGFLYMKSDRSLQGRAELVGDGSRLSGQVDYGPGDHLAASLDLDERAGGPLARRLPREDAVRLSLSGTGPLNAWTGRFDAATTAFGSCAVAFEGPLQWPIEATARIALDHPSWTSRIADSAGFEGRIEISNGLAVADGAWRFERDAWSAAALAKLVWDGKQVRIEDIAAKSRDAQIAGSLAVRLADGKIQGGLDIRLPSLQAVSTQWSNIPDLAADARLDLYVMDEHQGADLSLLGSNFAYSGISAGIIHARGTVLDPWTQPRSLVRMEARDVSVGDRPLGWLMAELVQTGPIVNASAALRGPELAGSVEGSVVLDAIVKARVDTLDAVVRGHRIRLLEPAEIKFSDEGNQTSPIRLDLAGSEATLRAEWGKREVQASVVAESIPLDLWRLPRGAFRGRADLSLAVDGPWGSPRVAGSIELSSAGLAGQPGNLSGRITASLTGEVLRLTHDLNLNGANRAEGRWRVPVRLSLQPWHVEWLDRGPVEGQLEAVADLAALHEFWPTTDSSLAGQLDLHFSVGGTFAAPDAHGAITLREGRYENADWGTILDRMEVRAEGRNDGIEIVSGTATDGRRGTLSLEGGVRLDPRKHYPFDVRLSLSRVEPVRGRSFSARVDGEVRAVGNLNAPRLAGELYLRDAEYQIPARMPAHVVRLDVVEVHGGQAVRKMVRKPPPQWTRNVKLDLPVKLRGNASVKGRGLQTEWTGGLQVRGTLAEPKLQGSFVVERGYLLFFGRRFRMEQSQIAVDMSNRNSVQLDLTGEARIGPTTVRIRLVGALDEPELLLESDPALAPEEIMALILFNKSSERLTALEAVRMAQTLNLLRGQGSAFDVLGRGQSFLRVDQLEIAQSEDQPGETTLTAGKYIGNSLYVEGEKNLRDTGGVLSLTIDLTPTISLRTETSNGAREGIRLNWQRDY